LPSVKIRNIAYSVCLFVALFIRHDLFYCHLLSSWLYCIFLHDMTNGMIFEKKKKLNTKYVLIFSTTCPKHPASCYHKCTMVLMKSTLFSC